MIKVNTAPRDQIKNLEQEVIFLEQAILSVKAPAYTALRLMIDLRRATLRELLVKAGA
jgi:Trm5-related predicted tRNA methylase